MKYFKETDNSGNTISLLSYDYPIEIDNPLIIEITKEEYDTLMREMGNEET